MNPQMVLGYAMIVSGAFLLIVLIGMFLSRNATKKAEKRIQEAAASSDNTQNALVSDSEPAQEMPSTSLDKNFIAKGFEIGAFYVAGQNCKKIALNYFRNGSCLVIRNDGSTVRKKSKYCTC